MDTQGVTTELTEIFSPVVTQCLLDPMARLGVNYLTHAANFCPLNEIGDQLERTIDKNHKGCFFFTPQMIRDKKISLYNSSNKLEFYKEGANKKYYHSYWRDALNTKRVAGNQSYFSTIEMGAFLPPWTIAECFRKDHEDAMLWMAGNAAAFPGNTTLFLSLKNEYATVFLKNMETTLVAHARLFGFQPLFLIKNAIVQYKQQFGIHGHQVTSINIKPKSYLALVGFYRADGESLQLITIKNSSNEFMVIRSGAVNA